MPRAPAEIGLRSTSGLRWTQKRRLRHLLTESSTVDAVADAHHQPETFMLDLSRMVMPLFLSLAL